MRHYSPRPTKCCSGATVIPPRRAISRTRRSCGIRPAATRRRATSPRASTRPPRPPPFGPNPTFSNQHSAGHAYLDDAQGTLLAHGGETQGGQQSFLFHPTGTQWELTAPTAGNRFYATTMTLADGRLLTMYGYPNTIEVYTPPPTG